MCLLYWSKKHQTDNTFFLYCMMVIEKVWNLILQLILRGSELHCANLLLTTCTYTHTRLIIFSKKKSHVKKIQNHEAKFTIWLLCSTGKTQGLKKNSVCFPKYKIPVDIIEIDVPHRFYKPVVWKKKHKKMK